MAQKEVSRLDRFKAELICSLCLEILTEPRKLVCDHSFCQECLQNHLQKSPQPRDNPPVQAGVAGSEQQPAASLVCPFCREKTTLPEEGVLGLKLNFKLKNLVDILSEEEREKTVQALGKGHKIRCHKQCTQHEEDCVFFCKDCKELLCRLCLSDSHKHHKWSNYDKVLPEYKERLRGSIQPAFEAAVSAQSAIQQLDEINSAVIQNQNSVKEKVDEYFGRLERMLEQHKSRLCGMVDRYTERKLDMLKRHSSDLQSDHSSLLQHLEQIEKQMEEDDVSLLTGIDGIEQEISLHCDTICRALSSTKGVDSFIDLREESLPLQPDHLGHLVLCQRDPKSDVVSTIQEFVDTGDMEDIQLDLARPADGMTVPEYMQIRRPETEDIYEVMSPGKLSTATNDLPPNTGQPPQPPAPMEQIPPHPGPFRPPAPLPESAKEAVEEEGQLEGEKTEQPPPCARRDRPPAPLPPNASEDEDERQEGEEMEEEPYSEASDSEDPYDTIPAQKDMVPYHVHRYSPNQARPPRPGLPTIPSTRPGFVKPIQVIDFQNSNVHPSGIACTNLYGQVYITDTSNMCLHMLDGEEILDTIEGTKERNGCLIKFQKPVALTISDNNHAYVLEQGNATAIFHKFSLNGDFVFTSFKRSRRKGPLKPWDIATSKDGSVYVSDWKRGRIYVYNSANGKKIRSIKGCNTLRERKEEFLEFQKPAGIAIDRGGRLMVTDRGEKCVWCINTDGDELIRKLGEDHLQNPYGIGVAKDGRVVVTESESDCVSVFGENGELLQYFGGSGSNEGQFCRPHHLFVDESDRVFIADKENRRIQIFKLP